jgi:hypothetical protein
MPCVYLPGPAPAVTVRNSWVPIRRCVRFGVQSFNVQSFVVVSFDVQSFVVWSFDVQSYDVQLVNQVTDQ